MHLDTHVLVWLHQGRSRELPPAVRELLDTEPLAISPMVVLELDLLHEVGRTTGPGTEVVTALRDAVGLTVDSAPFAVVVRNAANLTWTRDPFDRLICAQALAAGETLLTRDRRIRGNLDAARWD